MKKGFFKRSTILSSLFLFITSITGASAYEVSKLKHDFKVGNCEKVAEVLQNDPASIVDLFPFKKKNGLSLGEGLEHTKKLNKCASQFVDEYWEVMSILAQSEQFSDKLPACVEKIKNLDDTIVLYKWAKISEELFNDGWSQDIIKGIVCLDIQERDPSEEMGDLGITTSSETAIQTFYLLMTKIIES
jgi:hypothetical protein